MTPEPIKILGFPAHKLGAAREALAKLHARLARAATKSGQACPMAPSLAIAATRIESRCDECHVTTDGYAGGACLTCGVGYLISRTVLDLDLIAPKPALAGWEFIAVIEPMVGGNLIKKVPGSTEGLDFSPWRTGAIECDHCTTVRNRTETFIVRATGEDAAVAAGTVKQVGRNCLANFLGGKSPAAILASLTFESVVRGEGGDGEGGSRGTPVYEPAEFLAWTVGSIRECGWKSRSGARDLGGQATADHVLYLLTPPFGPQGRAAWTKARDACRPTDADKAKATEALGWAKALPGKTDYEQNLKLVAGQPVIESSHAGILASAVTAYERAIGKAVVRATGSGAYVGTVGGKIVLDVTVDGVFDVDTQYGVLHINKFRDADGNTLVWKTGSVRFDVGKPMRLKGTIKAHTEYKGEKQTELSRCAEVDPDAPVKVSKKRAKPIAVGGAPTSEEPKA